MKHVTLNCVCIDVCVWAPGLHCGSRLRPCGGPEVAGAGWEGGAGQRGQGDPLPRHAQRHGETSGPQGLPGLQGNL